MLLIATLLKHPGVGSPEFIESSNGEQHNSLKQVQLCLQNLAPSYGVELPKGYPSIPTLRKDLETLRRYGILKEIVLLKLTNY
jgi:hypothetical protein